MCSKETTFFSEILSISFDDLVSEVTKYFTSGVHSACANNFTSFGIIRRLSTEMSFVFLAEYNMFAKPPAIGAC